MKKELNSNTNDNNIHIRANWNDEARVRKTAGAVLVTLALSLFISFLVFFRVRFMVLSTFWVAISANQLRREFFKPSFLFTLKFLDKSGLVECAQTGSSAIVLAILVNSQEQVTLF